MSLLRTSFLLGCALAAPACSSGPAGEAAAADPPVQAEPYTPPPGPQPLPGGELIFACEQHLRVWQEAYASQRRAANREVIESTARSLARLVKQEQGRLEQQAVGGPPRNRAVAAAALGFSGDPKVLPLILNNVADSDPMVRANALLGIGVLAMPDTPLGPILDVVLDPNAPTEVIQNAAFAAFRLANTLRRDPEGGLSAILIPLLHREEVAVRAQAASGLGMIGAAHAVPMLAERARKDEAPIVRTAAAYALGEIRSPGSMETLVQLLADPDPLTAGTARGSLVKIHGSDLGPDPSAWEPALRPQ